MKVTQAIRDYITAEIRAKFDGKLNDEFSEYLAKKSELSIAARAIAEKANDDIIALCKENGFSPDGMSRHGRLSSGRFVSYGCDPYDNETEDRLYDQRRDYSAKASRKVNEVCFDLEIGGAKKEEIRGIIDAIEV